MNRKKFPGLFVLLVGVACHGATNDLTSVLQKGLFEEEANHNLSAAIQAYQSVVNQLDEDRKLAATAVFRLGECYRKQGKTNEALAQFNRVLRDFSDQSTLVGLSQQTLAGLGVHSATSPSLQLSSAARQEQKRLLEEEINLVEKKLATQHKQVEVGAISSSELLVTEREILSLKRQAAALDTGVDSPESASSGPPYEEQQLIRRYKTMLSNSPDLIRGTAGGRNLVEAATAGQIAVVTFLLDNGLDINVAFGGNTALIAAAGAGQKAVVDMLLGREADINAHAVVNGPQDGFTALHKATSSGYQAVVETLLAHNANVNARDARGMTPLHVAAMGGRIEVLKALIARKADVDALSNAGFTPLSDAAFLGSMGAVTALLDAKANPNGGTRDVPLMSAIRGSAQPPLVELLLKSGANPNFAGPAATSRAWPGDDQPEPAITPLQFAILFKQLEKAKLLLQYKADPNQVFDTKTGSGVIKFSPLLLAGANNLPEIVNALLVAGADPNYKSSDGTSPILNAVTTYSKPRQLIARDLVEHGADVNAQNGAGLTPLMQACSEATQEAVAFLLANKADVKKTNNLGETALHFLAQASRHATVNETAKSHADVIETAKMLLDAGAEVNVIDNQGQTPLNVALKPAPSFFISQGDLARLLRQRGAAEFLPVPGRIAIRRDPELSKVIFSQGSNHWNHFTLFELLGVKFDMLADSPDGESRSRETISLLVNKFRNILERADFAHVRIRRLADNPQGFSDINVDLDSILTDNDCSRDLSLEWGDVINIPTKELSPNETDQPSLTLDRFSHLKNCLTRQIQVMVNGQVTNLTLSPAMLSNGIGEFITNEPYWIKPALFGSKLLQPSSPLSNVKVRRVDRETGKKLDLVLDCSEDKPAPDFWLRDGDQVEIP